jgi:ABC-type antimicrobial peptide transport system permease subunit
VLESALVVLLGIAIGVLAAAAMVLAFHRGVDLGFLARGSEWLGAGRVLYPRLDVTQFAAISALVWALGVAAGLLPIWRIVRRVPVEAINRGQT